MTIWRDFNLVSVHAVIARVLPTSSVCVGWGQLARKCFMIT